MDAISPIMDALAMTQSVTTAVSQIIEQYSNSTNVVVRQHQSYIVPLVEDNNLPITIKSTTISNALSPTAHLGILRGLPTELVQDICLRLDLRSIFRMRVVNRQMSKVVDGIPQYQTIANQSLTVLKGLLSVEMGKQISCQMLYDKLKNKACETCGEHGTHLYLLKFRRVCYMCFMFR